MSLQPVLYVETNFVMAYAKGQALGYEEILSRARSSRFKLVMPQVCVMESFKAWERERGSIVSLTTEITTQIREMRGGVKPFSTPGGLPLRSNARGWSSKDNRIPYEAESSNAVRRSTDSAR